MRNRPLTYSEKLLDPRWQRRRLEVFKRDRWRCRVCNATTQSLHAHHVAYLRDHDPWEYPDHWLVTLCNGCHDREHRFIDPLWADLRVRFVDAGAVGMEGTHEAFESLEVVLAAAKKHGWELVAQAAQSLENTAADIAAVREDLKRGPGAAVPVACTESISQWAAAYVASECEEA